MHRYREVGPNVPIGPTQSEKAPRYEARQIAGRSIFRAHSGQYSLLDWL